MVVWSDKKAPIFDPANLGVVERGIRTRDDERSNRSRSMIHRIPMRGAKRASLSCGFRPGRIWRERGDLAEARYHRRGLCSYKAGLELSPPPTLSTGD